MASLAERFFERFKGLLRAHGRYLIPTGLKPNEKGKIESPQSMRKTVQEPVTARLWQEHLNGTDAIGIVPINDESMCYFGAIDIDVYPHDNIALEEKIEALGLPLIVCRTKSGGAHCYLFTSEPVPAKVIRDSLIEWAAALGYPGVEIFPKQNKLEETGTGNWINMPYHGGTNTNRYALKNGRALSPKDFLEQADKYAISLSDLKDVAVKPFKRPVEPKEDRPEETGKGGSDLEQGPPCLVHIAAMGGEQGMRNNVLFSFAIYLKKRYGDDGLDRLGTYNTMYCKPPLSTKEVDAIAKSVRNKKYNYKCKDEPIVNYCNRELCRKQAYGVGERGPRGADSTNLDLGVMKMVKTIPPAWVWVINGVEIEFMAEEISEQKRFANIIFNRLKFIPDQVKADVWRETVNSYSSIAEEVEAPADATKEGQTMEHLHRYCTTRANGRALEELLIGRAFTDKVKHRTYFTVTDFLAFLQQKRASNIDERRLFMDLLPRGLETHLEKLKGKLMSFWSIPEFSTQTTPFEVPEKEPEQSM